MKPTLRLIFDHLAELLLPPRVRIIGGVLAAFVSHALPVRTYVLA